MPDYRYFKGTTTIAHSAKGSEWKKHKYLKIIDGDYYYPDSYEGGRHLSKFQKKARKYFAKKKEEEEYGSSKFDKTKTKDKKTLKGKRKLSKKEVKTLATDVISGKYGVGQERMDKLGKKYNRVQNRVNRILLGDEAAKRIKERKRAAGLLKKKKG